MVVRTRRSFCDLFAWFGYGSVGFGVVVGKKYISGFLVLDLRGVLAEELSSSEVINDWILPTAYEKIEF